MFIFTEEPLLKYILLDYINLLDLGLKEKLNVLKVKAFVKLIKS